MISDKQQIADVFDSLHDGEITFQGQSDQCTTLRVEFPYVTEASEVVSDSLTLAIANFRDVEFRSWISEEEQSRFSIVGAMDVLRLGLQILDARLVDDVTVVDCDVSGDNLPFSGGEFRFQADGLVIFDDAGREMSLAVLVDAANRHWDQFGNQA